ncbi:MAG: UDP-3-O-(3-hydroxymyristoyl)glucosamine N-acyltransferase [Fimbriimonadia bacterium]|nr:UDP-3-O-(3-hydroxymyristoyl)glucosamine N-acyltransferase [Fimbriimonadia bacterium]
MPAYRLVEIAEHIRAVLRGDPDHLIHSAGGLEDVTDQGLTYAEDERKLRQALQSPAAAIIVHPNHAPPNGNLKAFLLHPNPRLAFAQALSLFNPMPKPALGVHPTAVIGAGVSLGDEVSIQPYAVIGDGAKIGHRVNIYPYVYVGDGAVVGDDCTLYPHAVVMPFVALGDRVALHPGAVVGGDGYAYVQHEGIHHKIPQIGTVVVEEDVEIGSNATIDRAMTAETRIGKGTKIDNLAQIAHNVKVGSHCLIVSQVGIAGSSVLEDYVVLAGQVGVKDHVRIGQGAVVGAQGGVTKNLAPNTVYWGTPAISHRELLHILSHFHRLPQLAERIQALEKKLGM